MIFDTLENSEFYHSLNPHIETGLKFLKENPNLGELPVGRLDIDGENVFALVQEYDTKPFDIDMWEAHKAYYDIQFIVEGEEIIRVSRIENMIPNTPYHKIGDYWLFSGEGDGLKVKKDQFVIFSPHDVHQPGLLIKDKTQPIKKIVVKALV